MAVERLSVAPMSGIFTPATPPLLQSSASSISSAASITSFYLDDGEGTTRAMNVSDPLPQNSPGIWTTQPTTPTLIHHRKCRSPAPSLGCSAFLLASPKLSYPRDRRPLFTEPSLRLLPGSRRHPLKNKRLSSLRNGTPTSTTLYQTPRAHTRVVGAQLTRQFTFSSSPKLSEVRSASPTFTFGTFLWFDSAAPGPNVAVRGVYNAKALEYVELANPYTLE